MFLVLVPSLATGLILFSSILILLEAMSTWLSIIAGSRLGVVHCSQFYSCSGPFVGINCLFSSGFREETVLFTPLRCWIKCLVCFKDAGRCSFVVTLAFRLYNYRCHLFCLLYAGLSILVNWFNFRLSELLTFPLSSKFSSEDVHVFSQISEGQLWSNTRKSVGAFSKQDYFSKEKNLNPHIVQMCT